MYVLQDSARRGTLTLALVALVVGMSFLAALAPVTGVVGSSVTAQTRCLDAADVLAAQDRSRNGVSLTCNQSMLSKEAVR